MGTLATTQVASAPTVIAPDLDVALRIASSAVVEEFGVALIDPDRRPTQEIAARLRERSQRLADWLVPGGERAVIGDVTSVLSTMACRAGSAEDMKAVLRIYASDLADLPAWAVSAACRDFRRGKAGDGHWAPTQAEIRAVAEAHLSRLIAEKSKIDRVLLARPSRENEGRKGDVSKLVTETLESLRSVQGPASPKRGGMSEQEIAAAKKIAAAATAKQPSRDEDTRACP